MVPALFASALATAGLIVIHAHSKSLMDVAMLGAMALLGLSAVALFTKADVAPLLALVGLLPWVQRLKPWQRVLIVAVPTLIVLGAAVGFAMSYETLAFGDEEY